MITDTRGPESDINTRHPRPSALLLKHLEGISTSTDRRQHQCEQLSAAPAPPTKQTMREWRGGIPGQLVGTEPTNPVLTRNGWKTSCESEAIGKPTKLMGPLGKQVSARALAKGELLP